MMNEVRFFDKANECVIVNGLYIHTVDITIVEIYIQSVARQAIEKGAYCVTISDEFGNYTEYDLTQKNDKVILDEYEIVNDDISSNMHCDTYGVCGGTACPLFYKCHA